MILDQILTGDARELIEAIPDESIDLIFTDPVYSQVEDYKWLAEQSMRILKSNRAVLVWCSKPLAAQCQITMEEVGLDYVYTLDYVVVAKQFRLNYYHLFLWTTPCLWMQKGRSVPNRWIPDTFVSTAAPTGSFKWNKNEGVICKWMDAFTVEGDVMLDPFIGSGTTAVVARQLNRHYIGFEINAETAQVARDRVASAQPSLFTVPSEQLELI